MNILPILENPNPILRKKSQEVSADELLKYENFLPDFIETMLQKDGVGLAAPQVHESIQLMVIELPSAGENSGLEPIPLTVLINPKYTHMSDNTEEDWEGCLSIPDMRGKVNRPKSIRIKYLDRKGKEHEMEASGFTSRVIQHEGDHLIGKLYVDRMDDMGTLTFLEEYSKFWSDK